MYRVCRVFLVSDTAQVELKSGRVRAPARVPLQRHILQQRAHHKPCIFLIRLHHGQPQRRRPLHAPTRGVNYLDGGAYTRPLFSST